MPRKYFNYINTLFVAFPMTFLMSAVAMMINQVALEEVVSRFFRSWLTMLPVAYIAAFIIMPVARKLTERVIK